jgi:MinD superfamily P-loop ATPase
MNIAIASGKGGTGKTTVAVNLALFLARQGEKVRYIDCDVEEPNGHLFFKPLILKSEFATVPVPVIDESKCVACGECVRFCQYRALTRLGKFIMVFEELCHGCGGCMLVCPQKAVTEKEKVIGVVEIGNANAVQFVHGRLNIGQAMSPPLIGKVLTHAANDCINIIDAPPGTSCPVITSVRNAEFVILVTEPTPFGLNDLGLAIDVVESLGIPHAAVINRAYPMVVVARDFCKKRNTPVFVEIPEDRRIAEAYSRGEMVIESVPDSIGYFRNLWNHIKKQVRN